MGHSDMEIERAFKMTGQASLTVREKSGDVQIEAWDDSTIRVRADGSEPCFTATENSVVVEPGTDHGSIDYALRVPRSCSVQVNNTAGDVIVEGTSGGATIQSQAGDVTLLRVGGCFQVKTANGDLSAEELNGALTFSTASGDLTVERSSLAGCEVESVSGDAEIETTLARQGNYRFNTVNGDLKLSIPRDAGATITMQTQQGEVDTDLPAEISHAGKKRWEGKINGGGARVEMRSVSGDLEIEGSDGLPAQSSHPSESAAPETARFNDVPDTEGGTGSSSVLEMLARGEIDVDEALAELDRTEA
jgi:DUF4097 and DUF4098 domain-containing protein YvlB